MSHIPQDAARRLVDKLGAAAPHGGPDSDLYSRLESLSKAMESSSRIDEHEHPDAYGAILDAMRFVAAAPSAPAPAEVPIEEAPTLMKLIRAAWAGDRRIAEAYGTLLADRMDADDPGRGRYVRQMLEVLRGERPEVFVHAASSPAPSEVPMPVSEGTIALRRACPICERDADIADLWNALDQSRAERDSLRAERDALKQTVHDELDANLRLREIGGAQPDEGMTTFLERVFSERDSLRAELAAVLAPHTVVHEVLVEQLGEKGAAAVTHAARAHVAALEALHAEVERLKQERDTFYMDYRMKCDAQTKSLHAEVERLRKDAERWRSAVDDYAAGVIQGYDPKTNTHFGYVSRFVEAIQERDAAMRQEPKA